jgi:LacI family transcriptional regulator
MIALGVIAGLRDQHVNVPGDISVVGFDDIELAYMLTPSLTTMRQPRFELGRHAALTIFKAFSGEPTTNTILSCELVIRGSTRAI